MLTVKFLLCEFGVFFIFNFYFLKNYALHLITLQQVQVINWICCDCIRKQAVLLCYNKTVYLWSVFYILYILHKFNFT